VVAGLRVDCEGYDGPVSLQVRGDHWRVVNNDLAASTAPTSGANVPRMGGITGGGSDAFWFGNHIHDIQGSDQECHGIYIDGDGSYDIGFNLIDHIRSGNGFQAYNNGSNGSGLTNDVRLHHNVIHDVSKHGINLADGSGTGFEIWNNLVTDVDIAGVRLNSNDLHGAKIWNNTFFNVNRTANPNHGVLSNDWNPAADALDVRNNIFVARAGTDYTGGSNGVDSSIGNFANNLWYGGAGSTSLDSGAVVADPVFVAAGTDFHLQKTSPAIDQGDSAVAALVTDDCDSVARPFGAKLDLGAYEYAPACGQNSDCASPPPCHTATGATCSAGACSYPVDGNACADAGTAQTDAGEPGADAGEVGADAGECAPGTHSGGGGLCLPDTVETRCGCSSAAGAAPLLALAMAALGVRRRFGQSRDR
jgi:uncharacterized protein (TIGR03382 family)